MSESAKLLGGRRLVLWRHGRTGHNAQERFQGQLNTELDAVGRCQAAAGADELALQVPDGLLTSDLSRTAETAAALASRTGLVATPDDRLREHDVGRWAGLTYEEVATRFPEAFQYWREGGYPRDWENIEDVAGRALESIRPALENASARGTLVVVSHGGTIRAVIGALLGLHVDSWWKLTALDNGHWSSMVETRRGWHLIEYNVTAYRPRVDVLPADSPGGRGPALAPNPAGGSKEDS